VEGERGGGGDRRNGRWVVEGGRKVGACKFGVCVVTQCGRAPAARTVHRDSSEVLILVALAPRHLVHDGRPPCSSMMRSFLRRPAGLSPPAPPWTILRDAEHERAVEDAAQRPWRWPTRVSA